MDTAQTTPTPQAKDGQGQTPALFPHVPPALVPMIEAAATQHGLPVRLVAAIVMVESAGKPNATRFEPEFQRRYIHPMCLSQGESRGRATSWGLMQIMGQTAYTIGFRGNFSDLLKPEIGLKWGCDFFSRLASRYPSEPWDVICRAYNGGPGNRHNLASTYPAKVLAAAGGVWPARGSA